MSKASEKKSSSSASSRASIMARLWDLGRVMSTQTVFLHEALAQGFGLNATDTKCLDLILREPPDTMTAGRLLEMTGLSSGAVTHVVDRLEKHGVVERARDVKDRRKVFLRARQKAIEPMTRRYESVGKAYMELLEQYSDDELRLICEYMEKTCEISQRELIKVVAANREAR